MTSKYASSRVVDSVCARVCVIVLCESVLCACVYVVAGCRVSNAGYGHSYADFMPFATRDFHTTQSAQQQHQQRQQQQQSTTTAAAAANMANVFAYIEALN